VKYTTVAIMGPQSSGKSTLLNAVVRSVFFAQCW
jgi:nicotinamide riboside kinase